MIETCHVTEEMEKIDFEFLASWDLDEKQRRCI